MENPLVSIIVPVYNVEKYLKKCLDSLIHQTYKTIEIICFNDASTDGSLQILNDYSKKDSRIHVINSTINVKQGGGRNRGLKSSAGEYICFVDSDDWVELDFVEKLLHAVIENKADIATADYYEWKDGVTKEISNLGKGNKDTNIQIKRKILLNGCRLWTSIIKRHLIFDNNLFFPEGVIYEDNAVGPALFLSANKIVKIDDNLYYYRQIQTSTTKIKNNYKLFDRLETSVMALENIMGLPNIKDLQSLKDEIEWLFIRLYLINTITCTIHMFDPIPIDYIRKIFFRINQYMPKYNKNAFYKKEIPYTRRMLLSLIEKYPSLICGFFSKIRKFKTIIKKYCNCPIAFFG